MFKGKYAYHKKAFLISFIIGMLLILPSIIKNGGYFLYFGDYNCQHIPFFQLSARMLQEGGFGWNWQSDLGVNFIGTYGGIIGNPFFWIMAIFPYEITHYILGPMMAIKMGLCSLTSFIFIKRFVKSNDFALIGSLLYAFSGYSIHNLVYYTFHDVMVFFPLLLLALEEAVINKRRVVFMLIVALSAVMNLYFFYGECIFLVIYFIIRLSMKDDFRINVKDFFCLAFESLAGVMIAGIIFIPTAIQLLDNPASINPIEGIESMFYERGENYGILLETLFFPAEIATQYKLIPSGNMGFSGLGLYLPLFSVAGVIGFIKSYKEKSWIRRIIVALIIVLFVPIFNSAFSLFNALFYARWLYMLVLMCCIATAKALENEECDIKFGFNVCAFVVGLMSLLVIFYPVRDQAQLEYADGTIVEVDEIRPNFMKTMDFESFYIIIPAVVMLIALYIILKYKDKWDNKKYIKILTVGTCLSCYLICGLHVYSASVMTESARVYIKEYINAPVEFEDDEFFRIATFSEIANLNILSGVGSSQSFISVVPRSIHDIYNLVGMNRKTVSSEWRDCYGYYALANVKYFVAMKDDTGEVKKQFEGIENPRFTYLETQGMSDIYLNNYIMPAGCTYDEYILYDDAEARIYEESAFISYYITDRIMVGSVVLTPEQAEKYSHVLTQISPENSEDKDYTYDRFVKDCEKRNETPVESFEVHDDGNFTVKTNYTEDELVVLTAIYDEGWSCTINGKPAEIEKVNGGFMAVYCEAGENTVEFTYETPGLKWGIYSTAAGCGLAFIWILIWNGKDILGLFKKKKKEV